MPDASNSKLHDDEVDLSGFGRFAARTVRYPFVLFSRNKGIVLAFLLIGLAAAVMIRYGLPKTYKSSFIIRPMDSREKFHLKILGDIQRLVDQNQQKELQELLPIDPEVLRHFRKLEIYNSALKYSPDSINYSELFIYSTDYTKFRVIQDALLKYLAGNIYFQRSKRLQLEQIDNAMKFVEKDLRELDTLKKLQMNAIAGGNIKAGELTLQQLMNPVATFTFATELQNRKNTLLSQKEYVDSFQLIKSCTLFNRPVFPPRMLMLLFYAVGLSLLSCFIFLAIRDWLKSYR